MATIGGYTVFKIDGEIPYAHDQDREIVRPGLYGKGSQWTGFWGELCTVETTTHLSQLSDKGTAVKAYSAMVKSLVTIVDDFGVTRYNIKVLNVRPIRAYAVARATDGAGAHLVCQWELEDWSTQYP